MLPAAMGVGPGQPDQDHGGHEHRRAAPPAGRSAHDRHRRQGHRRPGVDRRHHLGREVRHADPRQEPVRAPPPRPRHADGHPRDLLAAGQGPLRDGAVRRTDREREDDHPVRDAGPGQRPHPERDDDRGPGRVHLPVDQPDPDQRAGRTDLRHGPQVHPAPGPGRDPGRRDPGRRDGPDRRPVRPDRSPGPLLPARHGLRVGPPPLPRHGDRVVPDRLVRHRHRRAAPRSAHLPVVQDALHADTGGDDLLRGERRRAEDATSTRAPAATSAGTRATRTGSASTSSCR